MKIRKPRIVPAFYMFPEPRVVYEVLLVDGSLCSVESADQAVKILDKQCEEYVKLMGQFKM